MAAAAPTAVLVVSESQAVRARLLSDLTQAGYIAYGAAGLDEALRLVAELDHLDLLMHSATRSKPDRMVRLVTRAKALRPTLKIVTILCLGRTLSGTRHEITRRLWLQGLVEAVMENS